MSYINFKNEPSPDDKITLKINGKGGISLDLTQCNLSWNDKDTLAEWMWACVDKEINKERERVLNLLESEFTYKEVALRDHLIALIKGEN